jgi:predicted HAD superfamily Cof-like phosphohydrolase
MTDWVKDIAEMHSKYGVNSVVNEMDKETLQKFLQFRISFLQEELDELKANTDNPEEIVDACIDLCVVAIGTLDAFGIDSHQAWNEVFQANMKKEVGVKATRPNPLGLPDLIKPDGWEGPDHRNNHGLLTKLIE